MPKQVTIYHIAKALNIDSSTVSRALNNSDRVSEKTKKKIIEKAKELGYKRNILASNLRTNKTNNIGVIVPKISRNFFSNVISGIEETAYQAGYNVIICQSLERYERECKIMETLLANRVDGILLSVSMETQTHKHLQTYKALGGPIVLFDRPFVFDNCTNITINDYKASFMATEHLIVNGCQHIVHFGGPQHVTLYQNRKKGYKDALKKYHLYYDESYCITSYLSGQDGVDSAKKLLKLKHIDGLYAANDTSAIAAMQFFKQQGIKIPEDIAIVGFNNDPISMAIAPQLTTINQPDFEMGKMASEILINQITTKNVQDESQVLDVELITRKSSLKQ